MTAISSIAFAGSITPSQPWGYTTLAVEPLLNGRHFHCGIDLPMLVGTPIKSARAGRVGYVGTALVGVETGSQTDWYIHDDRVASGIAVGVQVSRGKLLCYSGNKVPGGGSSTGPHLHFEVQNSASALVRRFIVLPLGIRVPLAIRPGEMNNPATSVDPVPVLEGRFSGGGLSITPPPPSKRPRRSSTIVATTKSLHEFCRGSGPAFDLYHRRRLNGAWSAWTSLGGTLAASGILAGVDDKGAIIVTVEGLKDGAPDGRYYDTVSGDDGVNWSPWAANGAVGDSLAILQVFEPSGTTAASTDLTPVLSAVGGVKAVVDRVAAKIDKDLA